jgi:hypothetical protein
MLEVVAKLAD